MNLDLLKSSRFWQLALIGIAVGLNFPFPNNPWVQGFSAAISIWFGGSVGVGTFDRAVDAKNKPTAITTTDDKGATTSVVTTELLK